MLCFIHSAYMFEPLTWQAVLKNWGFSHASQPQIPPSQSLHSSWRDTDNKMVKHGAHQMVEKNDAEKSAGVMGGGVALMGSFVVCLLLCLLKAEIKPVSGVLSPHLLQPLTLWGSRCICWLNTRGQFHGAYLVYKQFAFHSFWYKTHWLDYEWPFQKGSDCLFSGWVLRSLWFYQGPVYTGNFEQSFSISPQRTKNRQTWSALMVIPFMEGMRNKKLEGKKECQKRRQQKAMHRNKEEAREKGKREWTDRTIQSHDKRNPQVNSDEAQRFGRRREPGVGERREASGSKCKAENPNFFPFFLKVW